VRIPIHPDLSDLDVPKGKATLRRLVHVAVRPVAGPELVKSFETPAGIVY
jgi:hypothetical protein